MKLYLWALCLCVVAIGAIRISHADDIVIHGSTTIYKHIITPNVKQLEQLLGKDISVIANGSQHGVQSVAEGRADVGMISAPLHEVAYKLSQQDPPVSIDTSDIVASYIGEARIAYVVHTSNPVKSMTVETLASILKGDIKNWQEIGGQDLPIRVVAERNGGGLRTATEKYLLQNQSLSPAQIREVINATQIPLIVGQLPNTLGIMSDFLIDDGVKALSIDQTVGHPLYLIYKRDKENIAAPVINAIVGLMQ